MNKIIIVLDSNDGHITKVFTSDPGLVVRVVDLDTEAQDPVWGPYDPGVTVVVADVDAAATEHIKENVPDYKSEEEQENVLAFLKALRHQLEEIPDKLGDAEDILIDDAAMNLLYTSIENITKRIDQKTRTLDPASGHFEESKEEQEFGVRCSHPDAMYIVTARSLEEAVAYVTKHRQELEPTDDPTQR